MSRGRDIITNIPFLWSSMIKHSLSGSWLFREAGTTQWLPAAVPGGVHTDLLALNRIPDRFVGENEKLVFWVSERDWIY